HRVRGELRLGHGSAPLRCAYNTRSWGIEVEHTGQPLKEGDHGPYGTLAAHPLPDGLAILFMPSLAALLTRAEELKGSPLTQEQVIRVRDAALAVVTPADVAAATVEQRGYAEVDAIRPWESWRALRGGDGGKNPSPGGAAPGPRVPQGPRPARPPRPRAPAAPRAG